MNRYFQEVLNAHQLIARWLADKYAPRPIVEQLLARFSPAFSMVTPAGSQLDYAALSTFFHTHAGAKAGLEIEIDNLQIIAESTTGATVTYQELQLLHAEGITRRFSNVVFDAGEDGRVIWRHLHETALHSE